MNDTRNIIDRYKGWTLELIREDSARNVHPFAVLMENWQGDFNLGTLIRNANVFGAREVFYLGRKKYDRRGTVGTHLYTKIQHLPDLESLLKLKERYYFVGVDNISGAESIIPFKWPNESLMLFGEEGIGLTPEVIKLCDSLVEIPQWGTVRSLNAGSASAIVLYDFVTKYHAR